MDKLVEDKSELIVLKALRAGWFVDYKPEVDAEHLIDVGDEEWVW